MDVAVVVLVAIETDQIRELRGADRRAELRAERSIGAGFLNRNADGIVGVQRLRISELGGPRSDHAGRAFKLQRVGKGVWIGEGTPSLTRQKILVLPIKLPQPYRVPVIVAQEVELEIDFYFLSTVVESSLPRFPAESGWSHRNCRILRMRRGRRRKAGRDICPIVCTRIVQIIEKVGFYKTAKFHVGICARKMEVPEQLWI